MNAYDYSDYYELDCTHVEDLTAEQKREIIDAHPMGEVLEDAIWTTPPSYGGHDPVGDIVAAVRNRDSGTRERSNFTIMERSLDAIAERVNPDGDDDHQHYIFRAGHWACGWVEYLIVPAQAHADLLTDVGESHAALADYPVLCETHLSELEHEEAAEWWENSSVADRIEAIRRSGSDASIFAARHDYMPADSGAVHQHIITG